MQAEVVAFLGGRKLEDLNADEVCILAAAPGLQSDQTRLASYRELLEEFSRDSAPQLLAMIRDAQTRLQISKSEHQAMIRELQIYLPYGGSSHEDDGRLLPLMAFRKELAASLDNWGLKIAQALESPVAQADINRLRSLYAVTEVEWEAILDQLSVSSNQDVRLLRARVEELTDLTALRILLRANRESGSRWNLAAQVMVKEVMEESRQVIRRILAILLVANADEVSIYASKIGSLAGGVLDEVLQETVPTQPSHTWHELLNRDVLSNLLSPLQADQEVFNIGSQASAESAELKVGLHGLLDDDSRAWMALENQLSQGSNCISATAYVLYQQIDANVARELAQQKLVKGSVEQYWLLNELLQEGASNADQSSLSNMDKFLWLADTALLSEVSLQKIAEIAKESESKSYLQHDYLFKEGDAPKAAIFLVEGVLQVEKANGNVLAKLSSGSLTGELGLLTGKSRTASLKVISVRALVIEIGSEDLNQLIERDSSVAASILRTVAGYI
jgi:hypothetical protein